MKAYKGFNKDMTCRGFQYEAGKTYHEDKAELCESGFHACLNPIDCLSYYDPAHSVYHEVELDDVSDEKSNDSKICGKTIKIGAKLSIAKIAKLSVDFVKSKCEKVNTSEGYYSVNTSEGDCSVNVSMGAENKNIASKGSVSVGWGKNNKCKGALGSYILIVERGEWNGYGYKQIGEPKFGKIDGITLKPDTWYTLKDGEFVEVTEND